MCPPLHFLPDCFLAHRALSAPPSLSVTVLFLLEVVTHMLERTTSAMTRNYAPDSGGKRGSRGIKTVISPVFDRLIKANKKVMEKGMGRG